MEPERSWVSHRTPLEVGWSKTHRIPTLQSPRVFHQPYLMSFLAVLEKTKGRRTAPLVGFVSLHTSSGLSWGTAKTRPKSHPVTASPSKSELSLAQQGQPGGGSWPSPACGYTEITPLMSWLEMWPALGTFNSSISFSCSSGELLADASQRLPLRTARPWASPRLAAVTSVPSHCQDSLAQGLWAQVPPELR